MTVTSPDPTSTDSGADLRSYLSVIRRRWSLILVTAIVAVAASLAVSLAQTPMYRTSTTISIAPVVSPVSGGTSDATAGVSSSLDILNSTDTKNEVIERIGSPADATFAAASSGSGSNANNASSNITITATSDDPLRAALIANTYVEVFIERRLQADLDRNRLASEVVAERLDEVNTALRTGDTLPEQNPDDPDAQVQVPTNENADLESQRRLYSEQLRALEDQKRFIEQGRVSVLNPASVPSAPYEPTTIRNVVLALIIGLAAGVALAYAREQFDDRVDSADSVERATGGLPLLGVVPLDRLWTAAGDPRIAAIDEPKGAVAESYRTLRTSLQFSQLDRELKILQLTSARSLDGKTTSVANLGVSLARSNINVLLVDLDLRRPRLHRFFDLPNDIGFTSVVLDPSLIGEAVATSEELPTLHLLTSGPRPPDPSEVLASKATSDVLHSLASQYDIVVLDSPPVLGVSDPLVISSVADATVLVVRARATNIGEVEGATELLRKVQANLIGTVVNGVDTRGSKYKYNYGYGYQYGYGYGSKYIADPRTEKSRARRKAEKRQVKELNRAAKIEDARMRASVGGDPQA